MNNKTIYQLLLIVVSVFAFFSCENEIEFKGAETKPLLVLNSILAGDSLIEVSLSESRFFLSNNEIFRGIEDAKIQVWKGNEMIETLNYAGSNDYIAESYYAGSYRVKSGDRIRITASAPGLDPVACETEIIAPPVIFSVDTVCTSFDLSFSEEVPIYYHQSEGKAVNSNSYTYSLQESYDLSITIADPQAESNYYRVRLVKREYYMPDGHFVDIPIRFESNDVVFGTMENDWLSENENAYNLFSDDLFNGKNYKLKLSFSNSEWEYGESEEGSNEKLTNLRELHIELHSLTKDYYLYLKSSEAARNNDFGIFAEPTQIYNNIQGGIGILGCYNTFDYVIPLRRK